MSNMVLKKTFNFSVNSSNVISSKNTSSSLFNIDLVIYKALPKSLSFN